MNASRGAAALVLNALARSVRAVRRRVLPNFDARRFGATRAVAGFLARAGRLDYVDDVLGHRMFLDDRDSLRLSVSRILEPSETRLVQRLVRPGQNVLDVGANIGYYTLLFARQVGPAGSVVSFEPDPDNRALLARNVHANGYRNVTIVPDALWETTGPLRLYISETNRGDHRVFAAEEEQRRVVEIGAVALDDFLAGGDGRGRVDFIKMDIQGAEAMALRGMRRTLAANPHLQLLSEFWPGGIRRAGGDPAAYLAALREHGFAIYEVHDDIAEPAPVHPEALLARFAADAEGFTSLYCRRE